MKSKALSCLQINGVEHFYFVVLAWSGSCAPGGTGCRGAPDSAVHLGALEVLSPLSAGWCSQSLDQILFAPGHRRAPGYLLHKDPIRLEFMCSGLTQRVPATSD